MQAISSELGRLIAARVSALPPRQREVLVLTVYQALTPRQVGEILGISEANVHSTLHVARQRLQKELAAYLAEK
jgi:RNA polymerase sigma factor (sigma-70 family)